MAETLTVTVAQVSPLLVLADGADTSCPCDEVTGLATLHVGDRITVEVRTPARPMATAVETVA
jgi:hypothetical protein